MKIVLASASPRRREIMSMVCPSLVVRVSSADESYTSDTPLDEIPRLLAERKACCVPIFENEVIIGCDTVVIHDGKLMGKPKSRAEAISMLKAFSGKEHLVVSGICIRTSDACYTDKEITRVLMRELSDEEIQKYVDSCEPYDKAGAYGIQEMAGAFVKRIDGDYYNVVGLPLCRLSEMFKEKLGVGLI